MILESKEILTVKVLSESEELKAYIPSHMIESLQTLAVKLENSYIEQITPK